MKKIMLLLLAVMLMCVPVLAGCGNSGGGSNESDEAQALEESAESTESFGTYDYVAESGKFTQSASDVLANIDKRMEGLCAFHILQEGPSVVVKWVEDQDVMTAVSCNKSDGQTPVESADEVPGGLVVGTQQESGEISEFAINGIVYVLQTLNSDLASDSSLYDTVKGMASEADAMKEDIGDGGFSKGTIGDFDVTLLTQDNDKGMLVMFMITER